MKNKPLVIAHRGFSGKFPENTMAAFQAAIEAGAQMIELDVHLSREGELLVTHDFELGRTCNGTGNLSSHSLSELRALDAGSWFHPRFSGERFPLLPEVLALAKGKTELNIELKEETLISTSATEQMARSCLEAVEKAGMESEVLISSFAWIALEQVRAKSHKIRLGLLNHEPEKSLRLAEGLKLSPYSYHPNQKMLSSAHSAEILAKGMKLFPYTANSLLEFQRLQAFGAHGIITNEVESMVGFLEAK